MYSFFHKAHLNWLGDVHTVLLNLHDPGEVSSLTGPPVVPLSIDPSPTWGLVQAPDQVFMVVNNLTRTAAELSCPAGRTCPRLSTTGTDSSPSMWLHLCTLVTCSGKVAGKAKLKGKAKFSWQNLPECSWLIRRSFHPSLGKDVTHQS